jgi:hypothetical protein
MHWLDKAIRNPTLFSTLTGVVVGAILAAVLSALVAERTTDLEHRPTYVSESLALVVEFTTFYDQQSHYFRDLADFHPVYALPDIQQKAYIEEVLTKLSTAEKQADLLGFKATRYFHGTDWLAKFEEIHEIWVSGAVTARSAQGISDSANALNRLSDLSHQLSEKTTELLERFILLLKELPAESNFFQHVPTPIPTPKLPDHLFPEGH